MQSAVSGPLKPEYFTTFGGLMRYLRERANLSQRELAIQVGYHHSYMSRIEKDERTPDTTTLIARFVPALGLEDEPNWTQRLLKLASGDEKTALPFQQAYSASPSLTTVTNSPKLASPHSSLPISLTPLLGREKEVEAITKLLLSNLDIRLITLVGAPGVGKTRLAAYIVNELAGMFAHGAAFADLTAVKDAKDMLSVVANALGVQGSSGTPLLQQVLNYVRQKNLLLLIDNFEHVIEAAPQLLQLLGNAPQVKVIVTSREALRVSGEHEFTIMPLEIPSIAKETSDSLKEYAVVQLFAQRAQAVDVEFNLNSENIKSVSEICTKLDGLPLAIELAAARIKFLSPEMMLKQFERHLDWAAHNTRDAASNRHTLRGAIEWSYDNLSPAEQSLMRWLSVFSGGWNAKMAEAICADDGAESNTSLKRGDVLNMLIQLTDKSLVIAQKREDETRFRFLETIREFSQEKLLNSGEALSTQNRLLSYFANFAEAMEAGIDGTEQIKWIKLGNLEIDNLRAALDWGLQEGANFKDAIRVIAGASVFWIVRNFFREGFERVYAYLNHPTSMQYQALRNKLLYRCGGLAGYLQNYVTGQNLCEQALELSRSLNDERGIVNSLFYLSEIFQNQGEIQQARLAMEEAVPLARHINYTIQLNSSLTILGVLLYKEGDFKKALLTLEEALTIATQANDLWGVADALLNIGIIHQLTENYDEAISFIEQSLEINETISHPSAQGTALIHLSILFNIKEEYNKSSECAERAFGIFQDMGEVVQQPLPLRMMGYAAIHAKNLVRARVLMRESLMGNYSINDELGQLASLVGISSCHAAEKDFKNAVQLCALAEKHQKKNNFHFQQPDEIALKSVIKESQTVLGKVAYQSAYNEGKALNIETTILKLLA